MGQVAVVVVGLHGDGVQGVEESTWERHTGSRITLAATTREQPRMHLDRLRGLPDLSAVARERGTSDAYAELERLKRAHDAAKTPYRYSTPYRNPPRPCKSGTHTVASIQHTLVNPARNENVTLWEADLHEAEVHGASLPETVVMFLGKLGKSTPGNLRFRFNAVQLVKQGSEMTLTVFPVWQDAQLAPPEGFENSIQTYRLSAEDFDALYRELAHLDLDRYAELTDADFEATPPDQHHVEQLHYAVNGTEVVSWSRSYQWLRPELRAPLLAIQRRLAAWADDQPAPAPGAFRRLMLRDVEGLNGGQNVYVYSDGRVAVQLVHPAHGKGGLQERRYEWKLEAKQMAELRQLLVKHPPRAMSFSRPGIPGEAQVEIEVIAESGARTSMRQWADGAQAGFAALHSQLSRYARGTEKRKPVREGGYEPAWRPE